MTKAWEAQGIQHGCCNPLLGHQLNACPGQQHESGCRDPGVRVWVAPELGLRAGGAISRDQPLIGDQEPDDVGRPWGLGISPDTDRLHVANGPSNDISVLDLGTEKEIVRIGAGKGPWGVAVVPDPR